MKFCKKCVLPETSAIPISFDENGVCSACRVAEEREKIDWDAREKELREILDKYRSKDGTNYDCIIPVSGGKDSHFQTYVIKERYGLNPLLVTFNHTWMTDVGKRNLDNLIRKFGVDHIMFTPNPELVRKLSVLSLKKMGDICWHCHAGIYTYPVQIAVKFKIPLIIWGESGYLDLAGFYSYEDMVEMKKEDRYKLGLRGFDVEDMVDQELGITMSDLKPFIYPSDEEIESVGVRGIYLGNYLLWDNKKQTDLMIEKYGFQTAKCERTYNTRENVECIYPGTHDYLRYLKFGYGRATDHACQDIRFHRMTREEGLRKVAEYDPQRPASLNRYLDWVGMTEEEFMDIANSHRKLSSEQFEEIKKVHKKYQ